MKLILVLIFIFFLRLPSLFEPNWYGDEGIYLAIGQALQRGSVLYRDIWDNKTPILYLIYALAPALWFAKLAATLAVLGTCVGVFKLAGKLKIPTLICTLCVGTLLSIPYFEGTIANAELFFILPVVWGAYLAFENKRAAVFGLFAGLAFLIKVPAIFDFVGFFIFLIIVHRNLKNFEKMAAGFLSPVLLVCLYFLVNRAFGDFIYGVFLNNATYVSVGSGPLSSLANPLFIKAATLILGSGALVAGYLKKVISKELLFLGLWFGFSLFGALISNRPYMHYLLQVVPPGVLLGIYLILNFKKYFYLFGVFVVIILLLQNQFSHAFRLKEIPYYRNFLEFAVQQKSWTDYVNFFDRNTLKTYAVAEFVRNNTNPNDSIFVWDDASNIYVLSGRKPATKFIQAHHLTLVSPDNYDLVIDDLKRNEPKLILIDFNSRFRFPKLDGLITSDYNEIEELEGLKIFKSR